MKPMMHGLVYISGPMTAKDGYTMRENSEAGIKIMLELTKRGIPSFCPHFSGLCCSELANQLTYDQWIQYDLTIIERHCTAMLMMPRWEFSTGARIEHDLAVKIGLPIFYSFQHFLIVTGETNVENISF
jgi:hypothetical protein